MQTVFLRLTPGFANQFYEYMAGYSLASKLGWKLVLDVSLCVNSKDSYLLDLLCIPEHKKLQYPLDAEYKSHPDMDSIPLWLRETCVIFSDMELNNADCYLYRGLQMISFENIPDDKDIYMCGWFFGKEYHAEYEKELYGFCRFKRQSPHLKVFNELTDGKETVGIHIRRGDFCAGKMAKYLVGDDFWRFGVKWFEKHIRKCVFFVFSDDIPYAKGILGNRENIYYVQFGLGGAMAVTEFLCLAQCKHKLLSRGSTFSRLADEVGYVPGRVLLKLEDQFADYRFTTKVRISLENIIYTYRTKAVERTIKIPPFLIKRQKPCEIQDTGKCKELGYLSAYEYFCWEVERQRYDFALDIAYCNYTSWRDRLDFKKMLIEALNATNNIDEAAIESVSLKSKTKLHFIIVPFCKSWASSRLTDLMLLGLVFFHLGHRVSLVLEPVDDVEEHYMRKHKILTTKRNVSLGCEQYIWEDAMSQGVESFLTQIKGTEEREIVISRRREFAKQMIAQVIFPDYSYEEDEERQFGTSDTDLEAYMLDNADYIVSYDSIKSEKPEKVISLSRQRKYKKPLWINGDYGLDMQNRLSIRHIDMAKEILKRLL